MYCRDSFREVTRLQIFMAENDIPFTYTDTISLSELTFLFSTLKEYLEEKNKTLNDTLKDFK